MPCSCQQNRNRTQYEVVTDGGDGRVVFTTGSKPTADTVAQRYTGSIVREKGSATPKPTTTA